jgi:hypothetical protein
MQRSVLLSGSLVLAALALPAVASASAKQYVLKHPKREHCKAHYVKKVEHGKTWCVYKALTPTSTEVTASIQGGLGQPLYLAVSGTIWPGKYGGGTQLVGLPISYTIKDATTGQTVGTFMGLSNLYATCTVVYTVERGVWTFTGQAVPPYSACAVSTVTMPAADVPAFTGSFAGNSTYAPSVSAQQAF